MLRQKRAAVGAPQRSRASREPKWAEECKHEVFGWIEKPFTVAKLDEFVEGTSRVVYSNGPFI